MKNKSAIVKTLIVFMLLCFLYSAIFIYAENEQGNNVIINQVYGGGLKGDNDSPVSHSFVELYNPTDRDINLNNYSIQYSKGGDKWEVYGLSGTIKSKGSYLIRANAENTGNAQRLSIDEFDIEYPDWVIDNKSYKIAVVSNSDLLTEVDASDNKNVVDLLGVSNDIDGIDACEQFPKTGISKKKSVRRINYSDTDNNNNDFSITDYENAVESFIEQNMPRASTSRTTNS